MIILAAGLSERMGVFKPLLPVGGQPAVMRCVRIAETAGIGRMLIVTGHMREDIEDVINANAPEVRIVYNEKYRDGMFSSAIAGVSALPDDLDGFFLLPADCCAVSPETLKILVEQFAKNKGAYVTRPKYEGKRGHPPLVPGRHIDPLLSYKGDNGLKGFLSPLPTVEVEMASNDALLDMDTPEDYAELLGFLNFPTYPTAPQCAELLVKHNVKPGIVEHGKQVADLALKIARLMEACGEILDTSLLESACLLHDICRLNPAHAKIGMELLMREGYPKAAMLVGSHMDLPGFAGIIGEAELLYFSDKIYRRGKLISLDDSMSELESRFANDHIALAVARDRINTAQAILDTLKARFGIGYKELGVWS